MTSPRGALPFPGTVPQQASFKSCASCPYFMSMRNKHQRCLYCIGKAHVIACCSIYHSFLPRTREARELHLCKHLMEEAICPRVQSDPGLMDLPEWQSSPLVSAPPGPSCAQAPAVPPQPLKPYCEHKKHGHSHKGGSTRGTASKCSIAFLCRSSCSPS